MTSATTRRTTSERRQLARGLPPLGDADARAIGRFIDAAWAEHGLARQTQDAYRRDLEQLARWCDGAGGGLEGADREVLFRYMAWRHAHGYQPRSNARLRASLRAFYAYLVRAGVRRDDPAALLDPPRLPRPLPKALTESQVDALLASRR
ncbi:MAG: site-specific integrase [Pseudoxanthomonas sp.]|nr:site-specific integrase [Pseudoxanthomonas sp.]